MAISWGSWEYGGSGGNGMRVGLDASWEHISHGETVATLTVKVYTENRYGYNDNQVLTYGGTAGSGSTSYNNQSGNTGNKPILRATRTYDYTYSSSSYGTSPGTRSFSATVSGAYNGVTPSKSVTVTIPARPYDPPAAPTGVTATRIDDTKSVISWTRNPTVGEPYDSITMEQRHWDGTAWVSWYPVLTLSGAASSYTRTGTAPNNIYQWRVRANNSAGSSSWAQHATGVNTTPDPPTSVKAAVATTGTSIKVTWNNNVYHSSSPPQPRSFLIERSVNGAAWASVATATASPWTDPAPGAGANAYRIASRSGYGTPLVSSWAYSNQVSTIVTPLAPTGLAPDGQPVDLWFEGATLTWQHNHGGDGVDQTRFEIETSTDQGVTWAPTADVSTSASTYTIAPGVLQNAQDVTWRVRTYGVASEGPSPWSTSGVIYARTRPVATLTGPTSPWPAGLLTATWTYGQQSGPWGQETAAQSEWRAELRDSSGTVLQEASGFNAATSHQFTHRLEDGTSYTVVLSVRSADGLWSSPVSTDTVTQFPEPAVAVVSPLWQPDRGVISLNIVAGEPLAGEDPVVAVTVERRTNGGEWVTLAEDLPVPTEIIDPLPTLAGANEYRVTSISAIPVYRVNDLVVVHTPSGRVNDGADPEIPWAHLSWVMVNSGESWSTLLKFVGDPDIGVVTGRSRASHAFLGRRKPVGAWGENRTRELSVSGRLAWTDVVEAKNSNSPREWEDFGLDAALVVFRDMHGRRVFGQISNIDIKHAEPGLADLSFNVTELDYREEYGAPLTEGGEEIDDFHIDLLTSSMFEAWGLSVNDNGDGTWTASSSGIIDFNNGNWQAEETDNVGI